MSTVGAHVRPPSRERATPPTWTLTCTAPSRATAIDRTSAGSPHGVYHASRPSIESNDSTRTRRSPSRRSRCASSVPMKSPLGVGARHVASGPSIVTRSRHSDPTPSQSARPSTSAHTRAPSTVNAVRDLPVIGSTEKTWSRSSIQSPSRVPIRTAWLMHGMILALAPRCEVRKSSLDSKVTPQNQHLTVQGGHGMFSQKLISGVLGLSLLSLTATACGTATGAAVGAGSGAAVGAGTGYGAGKGALIGLGVGAAAGAVYDITKHNK